MLEKVLIRDPKYLEDNEPDVSLTLSLIKGVTNAVIPELVVEPAHAVRRPFLGPIAPRTIPFLLTPRIPMLSVSDRRCLIATLAAPS